MLSVIIPAYNEENNIHNTAEIIDEILSKASILYEILFIDDGSKDETWKNILEVSRKNKCVHGYQFSCNFGKESAIYAGISYAKGDCCVVIDCDLQHPPEKIVEMFRLWEDGYEVIKGVKTDRGGENLIHTLAAKCFYSIISRVTGKDARNLLSWIQLEKRCFAFKII